jgi:molecular chaperone DnaJ
MGTRRSARARGNDVRYNLEITLEEAFAGKPVTIRVPGAVRCEACGGSGAEHGTKPQSCPTCSGLGRVRAQQGFFTIERTCPNCHGQGRMVKNPCRDCQGTGRVEKERTLAVNIPAGVEDGTRIRLAGEGEPGLRGAPPGDLYIFLSVKPHPFFERHGHDLHCRVPVSLTTAALGGQIEVPTLGGGRSRITIPEGTQSGRRFRLKSKGMPVMRGGDQAGDLYIHCMVETPVNLSRKQKELLRAFEEEGSEKNHPEAASFFKRVKEFFDATKS